MSARATSKSRQREHGCAFLDAGKAVVRVLLVPIAFSLACAGLFIFGLIAKYSDQHPMTSEDRNGSRGRLSYG